MARKRLRCLRGMVVIVGVLVNKPRKVTFYCCWTVWERAGGSLRQPDSITRGTLYPPQLTPHQFLREGPWE